MNTQEFESLRQRIGQSQARLDRNYRAAEGRLTRLENLVTASQVDMTKRFNAMIRAQARSGLLIAKLLELQRRRK